MTELVQEGVLMCFGLYRSYAQPECGAYVSYTGGWSHKGTVARCKWAGWALEVQERVGRQDMKVKETGSFARVEAVEA